MKIPEEPGAFRFYGGVKAHAIDNVIFEYRDEEIEQPEAYELLDSLIDDSETRADVVYEMLEKAYDIGYRMAGTLPTDRCPECRRAVGEGHKMDCSRG